MSVPPATDPAGDALGGARGLDGASGAAWSGAGEANGADDAGGLDAQAARSPFDVAESARYRRGHLIGSGGMGRVTQAFDARLGREVALKEAAADAPQHAARLEREAAITARLDHPSIVTVHDAGRTAEGALFYAMRVVRGRSLEVAIAEAPDFDARLRLLRHGLDACEAVAFAHRHGVVHRDLKPANIMVGEFGETQVLDWGLACEWREEGRARAEPGPADPRDAALTRAGAIVGTPRYMSPEQAAGGGASPRSDVWSLGALLFELCAGTPARAGVTGAESGDGVLAAAREGHTPDLRAVEPRTPLELAAVITRALARRPEDRYPDAKALADDLAAWLDGRRVTAHTYSSWDLLRRLVSAWRVPLAIGAAALATTAVVVALAFVEVDAERNRALSAEDSAVQAAEHATRSERSARAALRDADRALARSLLAEALARAADDARPEAELLAARSLALDPSPTARGVLLAQALTPRPRLIAQLALPASCLQTDVAPDLSELVCREAGSIALWRIDELATARASLSLRWRVPAPSGTGATILASAGLVLAAGTGPAVIAFERATGRPATPPDHTCCAYAPRVNSSGNAVQFSGAAGLAVVTATTATAPSPCPVSEELAGAVDAQGTRWASSCRDGALYVGQLGAGDAAGEPRRFATPLAAPRGPASALAFAPDGATLVLGTTDGRVLVYDTAAAAVLHDLHSGVAFTRRVDVSPDGRWAAILGDRGGPRLLELASGTWRGRLPHTRTRDLRFAAGRPADLVTWGATLQIWRLEGGPASALDVGGGVTSLSASPDGRLLAITRGKGVEWRRVDDGARVWASPEFDAVMKGGAFSPDRHTFVAAAGRTRQISRYHLAEFEPYASPLTSPAALREVGVIAEPGGQPLWLGAPLSTGFLLWPGADAEPLADLRDDTSAVNADLALSPDQRGAALLSTAGGVFTLDATAPALAQRLENPGATALALDSGRSKVLLAERGGATLYDLDTGALEAFFAAPERTLITVALSPDGRYAAAGDTEGWVHLWERETGALAALFRDHDRRVPALAFAPDSRWLASGSWDETVRIRALELPPGTSDTVERTWGLSVHALLNRL
ncbi:MAG: serine/threonine-protein kinase [Myxococcota bacterium]